MEVEYVQGNCWGFAWQGDSIQRQWYACCCRWAVCLWERSNCQICEVEVKGWRREPWWWQPIQAWTFIMIHLLSQIRNTMICIYSSFNKLTKSGSWRNYHCCKDCAKFKRKGSLSLVCTPVASWTSRSWQGAEGEVASPSIFIIFCLTKS